MNRGKTPQIWSKNYYAWIMRGLLAPLGRVLVRVFLWRVGGLGGFNSQQITQIGVENDRMNAIVVLRCRV